tara:strand:+ start:1249 stop:1455 length:207 start_codon:yes stop_codon:yes gene_type:complete
MQPIKQGLALRAAARPAKYALYSTFDADFFKQKSEPVSQKLTMTHFFFSVCKLFFWFPFFWKYPNPIF